MKRLYVAGPYSNTSVVEVLNNMRRGMRKATEKFLEGWAVFCPWNDYHFTLMLRGDEKLTVEDYYKYSLAWLEVSDAIYVLRGWETSKGTLKEIEVAKELGIPIMWEEEEAVVNA